MEMEKIIEKITQYRNKKGYTYENIVDELEITPAAYRKIETGETKLTVERLFYISNILEAPLDDLLGLDKKEQIQNNYNSQHIFQQKIEHFYQESKEMSEQLIKMKDELIQKLKEEVEYWKSK